MKRILTILLISISFCSFAQSTKAFDPIKKVKVYSSTSTISFEINSKVNFKTTSIEIYNFLGRRVYSTKTVNNYFTLSTVDFQKGYYIYKLNDSRTNQNIEIGRFMVAK